MDETTKAPERETGYTAGARAMLDALTFEPYGLPGQRFISFIEDHDVMTEDAVQAALVPPTPRSAQTDGGEAVRAAALVLLRYINERPVPQPARAAFTAFEAVEANFLTHDEMNAFLAALAGDSHER